MSNCYKSLTLWYGFCIAYYQYKKKRYTTIMTLKLDIVLKELRILRARSAGLEELYEKSLLQESTRNIKKYYRNKFLTSQIIPNSSIKKMF